MSIAKLREVRLAFRILLVVTIVLALTLLKTMIYGQPAVAGVRVVEKPDETGTTVGVLANHEYLEAVVTAYCACELCCEAEADGRTAWWHGVSRGYADQPGCAVAPKAIPYGTWLHIPGAGWRQADDTGGAMRQDWARGIVHIDLRFSSHAEALAWGVQHLKVCVEERP